MVLVFLALIPSLALLGLWGLSTAQLGVDWQKLAKQDEFTDRNASLARDVTVQLQEERRITGQVLADDEAAPDGMMAQRSRTDEALKRFRASTGGELSDLLRPQLRDAVTQDRDALTQVEGIRTAVDQGTITDEISFQSYTGVIEVNLGFFEALGNADNGELATAFKPLTDLMWDEEMLSREDAVLTYSWAAENILDNDRSNFSQWIGTQSFLLATEITPRVGDDERGALQSMQGTEAWNTKDVVEATLVGHHPMDPSELPRSNAEWRHAMDTLQPRFASIIDHRADVAADVTDDAVGELASRMRTYGIICLGTVIVVIILSVLLTNSLRRRILSLREEARRLETELPEVMERLRSGEDVDVDGEVREVAYRHDELGSLGKALNLARRSAVETAVRETEQHRGFQRMLQRIARRTQLLIGLQLKKLDEMERGQENPEILEGLFDLDHLTSRLRRYEENLVVLGGGQPQRRWRRPVRVVDVLRAALGEVQDYRRIRIEVGQESWLSGRAVGPLVHILAELMENAAAFSRPPNPVEARATLVGRGLAVEIEDRGLGMEAEDYRAVNQMMTEPPELDVAARAEDARLGLYVVARLAAGIGLQVEFRPSVYGGTRVVVMVPLELVAEPPEDAGSADEAADAGLSRVVAASRAAGSSRALAGSDPAPALDPARPLDPAPALDPAGPAAPAVTADTGDTPAGASAGTGRRVDTGVAADTADGTAVDDRPQAPRPRWALGATTGAPGDEAPSAHASAGPGAVAEHDGGARGGSIDQVATAGAEGGTGEGVRSGVPLPRHPWESEHARADEAQREPAAPARGTQDPAAAPATGTAGRLPGLPARSRGRALDAMTASGATGGRARGRTQSQQSADGTSATPPPAGQAPPAAPGEADGPGGPDGGMTPLPKRVRQANLAAGLKEPKRQRRTEEARPEPREGARSARSSGAAIGAFQRQSRLARGPAARAAQDPTAGVTPDTRPNHTEDAP